MDSSAKPKELEPAKDADKKDSRMKTAAQVTGFALVVLGTFTLLTLGVILLYGTNSPQGFAIVALTSCVSWFLAYAIFQTLKFASKQEEREKAARNAASQPQNPPMQNPQFRHDSPHWTFTFRSFSLVMTIVTGLIFGVSLLLWFDLTLPFLVVAPFILFFPFSYMAYSAFQRPVRIKRLRGDFELLTAQWDEDLYQQSTSFFNYSLHIALAILTTMLGLFVLFMPLAHVGNLPIEAIGLTDNVLRAMGFGFLGGFLFSLYYVYRRYTTSDLLPPVYLYCAITIMLGMVLNYISFRALEGIDAIPPEGVGIGKGLIDLLSFAIGFFPILAVQWLTRVVYQAFGQPMRRSDLFPLDQLDGISQAQEVRLRDFGIDDAQNLASTEMPLLLLNTPFPVQTVVDWVDQSVLTVLLNDKNALDNFRKAHVRTMTDFRDLWGPSYYKQLKWKRELETAKDEDEAKKLKDKLDALKDEQTDMANALNSNIALLNALYISTNFDMNIHYLNNYRKNVTLLLPGWASARFNRYLVEAYQIRPGDPDEIKNLSRLWNCADGYLQVNDEIKLAQQADPEDDSLGMIVEPICAEARLGLARLYEHNARIVRDEMDKKMYAGKAQDEYRGAIEQILNLITQNSSNPAASSVAGWMGVYNAAYAALQKLNQPPPPGGGNGGGGGDAAAQPFTPPPAR